MNEKEYIIYKINSKNISSHITHYLVGTVSGIPLLDAGHYRWTCKKEDAKRMNWDEVYDMMNRLKVCYCGDKWDYYISPAPLDYVSYFDKKHVSNSALSFLDKTLNIDPASSDTLKTSIKNVIFNNPATIVFWNDGTKTVVKKGRGELYDPEKGLAMCIAKRALGNKGNYYNEFRKWLPKDGEIV